MKTIYALGIGHNTPVFIDLAESAGYEVMGLYHYNANRTGEIDHGFEILGSFDDLWNSGIVKNQNFLLTMGDSTIREEITSKIMELGGRVPSIVHPSAVISRFANINPIGVYISAFTHVQADTSIDEGTILLSGVNISHTNRIGKYCFVAGGATIGAYTQVKDHVFVGQGALTISDKVEVIGEKVFIGAGSLVIHSLSDGIRVKGRPAKEYR